MRKEPFVPGEFYHCYNRGVDKRVTFETEEDFEYFLKILNFFNDRDTSVSIRERQNGNVIKNRYVSLVAYCLNKNHFHLLLKEENDGGISKYMQKVSTGYTMYFNQKYKRSGSLFQGKFKSKHVDNDLYMKHLGVYINVNNQVHGVVSKKEYRSSFMNFVAKRGDSLCDPYPLLALYDSDVDYTHCIGETLPVILKEKEAFKELFRENYHE
jgi:putative transposase